MNFYFSGIKSANEFAMLQKAGASHILVDPTDYATLPCWDGHIALDSGSYRAFKDGRCLTPEEYARTLSQFDLTRFDWVITCDVIRDPEQTRNNWISMNRMGLQTIPVWQWGAPVTDMQFYLEHSDLVALGGLVPLLRDKRERKMDKAARKAYDAQREEVLSAVEELVSSHPNRFHFLGLCWLKALNQLKPHLVSGDSSLWLEGARYAFIIFQHARSGLLQHAPVGVLSEYKGLGREERCITNAYNIIQFFANIKHDIKQFLEEE